MPQKVIILIGPPGSGKDTQADLLEKEPGVVHLKSSKIIEDNFRADPENPEIKKQIEIKNSGGLVDPPMVQRWIKEAINKTHSSGSGIIFSGSPRTLLEAEEELPVLESLYGKENIIGLDIILSEDESVKRNSSRRVCKANSHPVPNFPEYDNLTACPEDGREILKKISAAVRPGIATHDLEELARELILSYKVKSSFLGYDDYPAVLCTSVNDEIVHALPSERMLTDGDLLKIDTGIIYKNFHTDTATTLIVGEEANQEKKDLIIVTRQSLEKGISKARPGNTLGDIGFAVQSFVESKGFNVVRDLVGHGIGRDLHEAPQVPNYGEAGKGEKLLPGMVIAIEPMVVTGSWKIKNSPDGYGFMTKDAGLAAHFEHTVAITENGPLILTS